jgi:cytochrome P450
MLIAEIAPDNAYRVEWKHTAQSSIRGGNVGTGSVPHPPPGPVPLTTGRLAGPRNFVRLALDPQQFMQDARGLGDIAPIMIGPLRVWLVNSPELLFQLLVRDAKLFDNGRLFEKAKTVLGNGLLASDGELHMRQRRAAQPVFHRTQVTAWADTIDGSARKAIGSWREGRLDVSEELHQVTLTVLLDTIFSVEVPAVVRRKVERTFPIVSRGFVSQLLYPRGPLGRIPLPGNVRFHRAARELRSVFDDLIPVYRNRQGSDRGDVLSLLCGSSDVSQDGLAADQQIRDEVISFLVAGTESVAGTMSWLLFELTQNANILERLREEIRVVLDGRRPRAADLDRMPFLANLVTETLRLHTPTWILTRRPLRPVRLGDKDIPAGADIIYSQAALHRDPDLYPDPLRFDPDRWNSEQAAALRASFIPFGMGQRKCIGEFLAVFEMKIITIAIVSRWHLTLPLDVTVTPSKYSGTVVPCGLRLHLSPRANPDGTDQ